MEEAILKLFNITKSFKEGETIVQVLQGISADFHQQYSYAISGVSGSGKSTLLHILAGIEVPDNGTVIFHYKNLISLSAQERSRFLRAEIGLVFQNPYLIRELTVVENAALKGLIAGEEKKILYEQAASLLEQVGLGQKLYDYPGSLSGGQQQRVSLVRALLNKPKFLLADEPTGNLDRQTAQDIIDLLSAYQKRYGLGLIVCSHDPHVLEAMTYGFVLKDGLLEMIKGANI